MTDDATAPSWVQSVTPAEIVRQRQLGWPDFHPEDFCHVCGHRNAAPWSVPAEVWGEVFDSNAGIVCPSCFTTMHATTTGDRVCWELRIIWRNGEVALVAPDVGPEFEDEPTRWGLPRPKRVAGEGHA